MTATRKRPHAPGRVPPPGEDLEFVRNGATGTVHVLRWCPYEPWHDGYEEPHDDGRNWGEKISEWFTGPGAEMLCGEHLKYGLPGCRGDLVSAFPDTDICGSCVRVLGDQASRAFEHPQADGDEGD